MASERRMVSLSELIRSAVSASIRQVAQISAIGMVRSIKGHLVSNAKRASRLGCTGANRFLARVPTVLRSPDYYGCDKYRIFHRGSTRRVDCKTHVDLRSWFSGGVYFRWRGRTLDFRKKSPNVCNSILGASGDTSGLCLSFLHVVSRPDSDACAPRAECRRNDLVCFHWRYGSHWRMAIDHVGN